MRTLEELLKHDIDVKINTVVMAGKNTQDILPLVAFTNAFPVSVRFIEEMPFNGDGHNYSGIEWDYIRILEEIKSAYPDIKKIGDAANSTAYHYSINNHQGNIGVIAAYSRTFCGTCNRIRLTPEGTLKTCLYGDGKLNIKDQMRLGMDDAELKNSLLSVFSNREKNGWDAESNRLESPYESMASIGG